MKPLAAIYRAAVPSDRPVDTSSSGLQPSPSTQATFSVTGSYSFSILVYVGMIYMYIYYGM